MKTYYHYTHKDNIASIIETKTIDSGFFNYVCDTKEDVLKFINFYTSIGSLEIENIAIVAFQTKTAVEESFDHNVKYINAKAYYADEPIIIEKIKNIFYYGHR